MKNKIRYRIWQFGQSFNPPPSQEKLDRIRLYLTPVETMLFIKMPVPDQNHSIRVFESVLAAGESDNDLVKAALLHDIGKGLYPLQRWERVFAVVMGGFFPRQSQAWGKGEPNGFYRPLVVIQQHPDWGAELAREAGCSETAIWLIKNHEQIQPPASAAEEKIRLLNILQIADNQS